MTFKAFEDVSIPSGLDDSQIEIARQYVHGRNIEGLTITDLCKKYNISSNTLYNDKHLKNPTFNQYVNRLIGTMASDELEDYRIIANKVKQNALKPNATQKEIDTYLKVFDWVGTVIEATEKQKHGITDDNQYQQKSVDELRLSLIDRLQKKGDKENE